MEIGILTWCLLVLCLVLTNGGQAVDSPQPSSCIGVGCVRKANSRPEAPLRVSRTRRQSVIVVEDPPSHRLSCTKREERKAACLNGECYALDLGGLRNPFCHCPEKYEGRRCEQLSVQFFLTYSAELKKAAIIGGVVVGIIMIIVSVSVYCSYRKGKRKRKGQNKDSTESGSASGKHETAAMLSNGGDSNV